MYTALLGPLTASALIQMITKIYGTAVMGVLIGIVYLKKKYLDRRGDARSLRFFRGPVDGTVYGRDFCSQLCRCRGGDHGCAAQSDLDLRYQSLAADRMCQTFQEADGSRERNLERAVKKKAAD